MSEAQNPVDAAIESAKAKAAEAEAASDAVVEMATNNGHAVPATPMSMESFIQKAANSDVAGFIKYTPQGITVGKEDVLVPGGIKGTVSTNRCTMYKTIRVDTGDGTKYVKSTDGVTTTDGDPWAATFAKYKQLDDRVYEYMSADIGIMLTEDIPDADLKVGDVVIASNPPSGQKNVAELFTVLTSKFAAGVEVEVTLNAEKREKKGVRPWAVPKYTVNSKVPEAIEG